MMGKRRAFEKPLKVLELSLFGFLYRGYYIARVGAVGAQMFKNEYL